MLCPKCGKESKNLRVCGHCHTPYPVDEAARAARGADTSRNKRWAGIGLLAVFTVGFYFAERERPIPAGVVVPNVIVTPMSADAARNTLESVNHTAKVEVRDGQLTVQVSSATFPERRAGQLALAQQYARADEIVQGHKRAIAFLDPSGSKFATADPEKGVMMTH